MHELAFKDPAGRVFIMDEHRMVPPLADGYEWTFVFRSDDGADERAEAGREAAIEPDDVLERDDAWSDDGPANEARPHSARPRVSPGLLDVIIPLFTPQDGQTPQERAKELVDAIPEDVRVQLSRLVRAIVPPRAARLPPFPGAR